VTHNDEQIDLLIRRFAGKGSGTHGAQDHLDADEMNALAEGALPPAARARYVSHLANCDECRKQVTQLAIASSAVARTEQSVANMPQRRGFWAVLSGMFALPVLRYAGVAAILVMVAAVAFVALRRRSEPAPLVATTAPLRQEPLTAVKAPDEANDGLNKNAANTGSASPSTQSVSSPSPLGAATKQNAKSDEDRIAENTTPQVQPMKEAAKATEESEKKAEQVTVARSQQSQTQQAYAPAPPGEAQSAGRGQTQSGFALGGGLKTQPGQAADKAASADRERDFTKDARLDTQNQQAATARKAENDEKLKGPSRNTDVYANNRTENRVAEAPKRAMPQPTESEEAPKTRAAGGHKFRRQGNSWVDQKFKSSMPLKNVSRGSDDFAALDGGLRSIAQQISGEVIIVWKGKAYLIK
jgi:putative zinc finger protein